MHLVLAEDKPRLAAALAADLALFPQHRLTAIYSDGEALLAGVPTLPNLPDLVLMDIEMPRLDGIAATAELKRRYPQMHVLMLTVFEDEDALFRALRAGADGYLLKGLPPEELAAALEETQRGGVPLSPPMARKALRLIRAAPAPGAATQDRPTLSEREIEVLEQLAAGLTYKAIASNLFLSVGTVRKHVEHVYRKLRVNNKVSAVARGRDLGLVDG